MKSKKLKAILVEVFKSHYAMSHQFYGVRQQNVVVSITKWQSYVSHDNVYEEMD
uniref:Uncharacterized protein n=1 Tax=Arundo donax TaxID=35708 RepID=A0A0A8YH25_ARUDO